MQDKASSRKEASRRAVTSLEKFRQEFVFCKNEAIIFIENVCLLTLNIPREVFIVQSPSFVYSFALS